MPPDRYQVDIINHMMMLMVSKLEYQILPGQKWHDSDQLFSNQFLNQAILSLEG